MGIGVIAYFMAFGHDAPDDARMKFSLLAQQKKSGRDAVLVEHVQKLGRIARGAVIKGNGAEVLAHALIHNVVAVHHAGQNALGRQKHTAA